MNLRIKNRYLVAIVLIIVLSLFGLGWYYGSSKERSARIANENALNNEIKRYKIKIGQNDVYIAQARQLITNQRELIKEGIIEREVLKKLNTKHVNEISRLKLRIDTLLEDVAHNGQIIEILDSRIKDVDTSMDIKADSLSMLRKKAILLPFEFYKTDQWLSLKGNFNNQGKLDISLKIDSISVDIISSIDRKTKNNTINILTDCPYIQTIGVRSYKTDVQKPKRYGLSVYAGYGISREGLSPQVGAGISYSFIRF